MRYPPVPVAATGKGTGASREALRRLASGVAVLTVRRDDDLRSATVSALVAMSREPLLVGACLRPSSAFGAMVRSVSWFSVNMLAADQAELARRFADPARPSGAAQFDGLKWEFDELTGAPVIAGCIGHLACHLLDWRRVGDHDLMLARVIAGEPGAGAPLVSSAGQLYGSSPLSQND